MELTEGERLISSIGFRFAVLIGFSKKAATESETWDILGKYTSKTYESYEHAPCCTKSGGHWRQSVWTIVLKVWR